ncbi:hypothetical protein EGI11_03150 [Chryseobacterium sp. H3056]|uniref:Uncharacterized protein n=1 Tax=Kaistella daneshvariae TaxID=2487074 RepID=A0A3N0WXE7_9FLAO|nr:hypothetical protein [Kaistella daneshvariae]ROI09768.1 hypothetical protein EGI11_03150 [Kaistella daneshvariae]
MKPEVHQEELSSLFADTKVKTQSTENPKVVKAVINRDLSRAELGHCFSLGMCAIKRSGAGISISFDLTKATLNEIYKNLA